MGKLSLLVRFSFDVVVWFWGLDCFDVLGVRSGFVTGVGALRLGVCASAAPTSCTHEGGATKQFHRTKATSCQAGASQGNTGP